MEPRNRANRPVAPDVNSPVPTAAASQYNRQATPTHQQKPNRKKWFIIGATTVLILVIVFSALCWFRIIGSLSGVKADKYQAVILGNSQVYFGKITAINHDAITLRDVYYFKAPTQTADDSNKSAQQTQTLIKLGNEVHAPDNEMRINTSQILYWENLRDDGQVVKTIKQDK